MTNKFYHYTLTSNAHDISENGIQQSSEGVFMTDTPEGASMFALLYETNGTDIFIYEINASQLDYSKLVKSTDHNEDVVPTNAFIYYDDIPSEYVKVTEAYTINKNN